GRCHERESVPYKAFDGVVDALSKYLSTLPTDELERLLPASASLLGHLFPVLQEVCAKVPVAASTPIVSDTERRTQSFDALRRLLDKLSESRTVCILIDDLQWADADSLTLLRDLLRSPQAPCVYWVATVRAPLRTLWRPQTQNREDVLGD